MILTLKENTDWNKMLILRDYIQPLTNNNIDLRYI